MHRAILICGCAALALAACSKKADTAGGPAAVASTPAATASAAPPTRKGGLWEQTMDLGSMKQTISMCVDAASEAKARWWSTERGAGKADCAEQSVTPTAGGWSFHSVCKMGDNGTVTSDGTATGDFGSHYKVEVTSVTSGAAMAQANGTHKVAIEATWKGACPPDMKAGDMMMPGGMKISSEGGTPHVETGPGGVDMAKMRAQAMSGHMDQADIVRMRAQAEAMAKQMKSQAQ